MYERVRQEIELLRMSYPDIQFGENLNWVLIPNYQLPTGLNKSSTRLLWNIPPGYPQTPPDDFFVEADLRRIDGTTLPAFNIGPNSSSGPAQVPGDWAWFSWHPEINNWHPSPVINKGDNLTSFLRSVNTCLRGEE